MTFDKSSLNAFAVVYTFLTQFDGILKTWLRARSSVMKVTNDECSMHELCVIHGFNVGKQKSCLLCNLRGISAASCVATKSL